MTITLLLDLDDTLLETNMDAFIPAYFQALAGALAAEVAPEKMIPALAAGTKAMLANLDPSLTLRQVFDSIFYVQNGLDRSALQPLIDHFYEQTFPTLQSVTRPIPEAIRLVDWAFEQGFRVAIATNPIFPLRAIEHRLRWAGLAPEKYPFALVTSYETFHFTKEMVAFYPEVMAQLGWPEDPVVMVGDDVEREVKPTQAAGLPVFWIRKSGELASNLDHVPHGDLASVRPWLENTDPNSLRASFQTPQALLACLRSTPAALTTLCSTVQPKAWLRRPEQGEWCLTEILCHLRDVERDVDLPRLNKVLAEENPFIAGEVTDRWAEERQYLKQDGGQALLEFSAGRKEVLALLGGLQTEWSRFSRHAIFGPTTFQELIGIMAEHDRAHIQQVWKTIKAVTGLN